MDRPAARMKLLRQHSGLLVFLFFLRVVSSVVLVERRSCIGHLASNRITHPSPDVSVRFIFP